MFDGNLKLELYDLSQDSLEQNDISDQHPEIVLAIERIMEREHVPAEIERFKFEYLGKNERIPQNTRFLFDPDFPENCTSF